ncbi:MAG: cupin domain-containing protein [Gammaproteobacteria bacterium]|nr:cupin domain-containing protein [Gammaproteobacteria bacterium]MDH4316047.1 cupin domain-containing protein [Gammaproteobacteria bacterium]MDH5213927.1 cupin domain-containing protein [Gammaproteobacteria bacterium]MDH5501141.1 cupin domain-containing protein [Gammaproteobacteria bacterium]
MTKVNSNPQMLAEVFAVLKPDQRIQPVPLTPEIYTNLNADFAGFKNHVLISSHEFSEDWSSWERHPAGDELVMLLSGSATLVLRTDDGDRPIDITEPGSYVIVPRNTWHTARVSQATRMLFVTPGEGTENVEEP